MARYSPYTPYSSYKPSYAPSRAPEIILEGSRGVADAMRQKGAIWANALGQIGQQVGQVIQSRDEKKAAERQAMLERQRVAQFGEVAGASTDPRQVFAAALQLWGPEKGLEMARGWAAMEDMTRARADAQAKADVAQDETWRKQQLERMGVAAGSYLRLDEGGREAAYGSIRERVLPELMATTGMTPEDAQEFFPEKWSPEADKRLASALKSGPWAPPPVKVSEGEALFNPLTGETNVPNPKAPKMHKVTVPGPDGRPMEKLVSEEELAAGVPGYVAPKEGGGPKAPTFRDVNGQLMELMPDGSWSPARLAGGGEVPAKSTVSGSGGGAAAGMNAVVDQIDELSKRINVSSGVSAVFGGKVRRAKAGTNYDDDVSQYEALVKGFTPMVARAVGHTGVLTEQDVQSVRALFPRPEDSASVRDRKIEQLRSIMSKMREAQGAMPQQQPEPDAYEAAGYKVKVK